MRNFFLGYGIVSAGMLLLLLILLIGSITGVIYFLACGVTRFQQKLSFKTSLIIFCLAISGVIFSSTLGSFTGLILFMVSVGCAIGCVVGLIITMFSKIKVAKKISKSSGV